MYKQYVLTLDGTAQRLSTALGLTDPTPGLRHISFQPGLQNGSAVFLGDEDVTATEYAVWLGPAAEGVPPAPYIIEGYATGPFRLSDFYLDGADGETVHIGVVEF